jgi:hypothetical protein
MRFDRDVNYVTETKFLAAPATALLRDLPEAGFRRDRPRSAFASRRSPVLPSD